jgi:predicted ATPase
MNKINRIHISGFRSIRDQEIELAPINVLVGANGSGKSNFLSLFSMLNFAMTDSLQLFIAKNGGANSILHYGAKTTEMIDAEFEFETDDYVNWYSAHLGYVSVDTLAFNDEEIRSVRRGSSVTGRPRSLGVSHRESALKKAAEAGDRTAKTLKWLMDHWRSYQFHDTSPQSPIRQKGYLNDGNYLRHNAGNLAAFLYGLRESRPDYYTRILETIRLALPFFGDFILEPTPADPNSIILDWKERSSDYRFGPHQIADGALRFMALATLLLQPKDRMPSVITIDEPELGLHPYAISLLGALINSVSTECQVIVATQSTELLDQFKVADVIVVDRQERESIFQRLDPKELAEWLEEYTVSEMWRKNILGGHPHR